MLLLCMLKPKVHVITSHVKTGSMINIDLFPGKGQPLTNIRIRNITIQNTEYQLTENGLLHRAQGPMAADCMVAKSRHYINNGILIISLSSFQV